MATASLHPFEKAVLETIRRRRLLPRGARALVALSGGPDSTALVAALAALRDCGELSEVSACHVDHQLRAGSAADGDFCAETCAALGVPLRRAKVTVEPHQSIQAAARKARYRALATSARSSGADWIATGHTRSDQAETVLHRLLRGSGARGLAAIPPSRGRIIRPLIDRSRAEVVAYLRDRGLAWREDPSNASPRFLRNRIRSEVVPLLEALAPGVERRIARAADLLREDDRALERRARALTVDDACRTSVASLAREPMAVRRRVVRRLWRAATGSRRHLTADHVDAIVRLLGRKAPGSTRLPGRLEARVSYDVLEIGPPPRPVEAFDPVPIGTAGEYRIPGGARVAIRWSSAVPPPWPLELRTRRPGDRFHPAGRPGGKKLKAWLIDQKVPRARRDALLVIADRAGNVLCLPELDARAAGAEALEVKLEARAGQPPDGKRRCKRSPPLL